MNRKFIKLLKVLHLLKLIGFVILFGLNVFAQDIEITLKITNKNRLNIEGKFLTGKFATKDISFIKSRADANNLAEKIQNLELFDEKNNRIEVKKLIAGEYLASQVPAKFQYQINLNPSEKITDSAHASWFNENHGLLMLDDLLPQIKVNEQVVKFALPADWQIFTTEKQTGENIFAIKDYEKAVFLVGKNLREKKIQFEKSSVSFVSADIWQFSDDEALEMAKSIFDEYKSTFNGIPNQKNQIILLPFPQDNSNTDRWRAETRGSTVTIISGVLPYKNLATQRLHEQLRHEIFHLWMPNGLNLSGNYAWFYEGFAVYHALRTGVELNQIRFEDFLNTLGRAFDLTQIVNETQTLSLIEASQMRWAGESNFLYAKGIVVAFLCDLTLLRETKGRQNLKNIFRQIYEKHQKFPVNKSPEIIEITDGNTAILNILKSYTELNSIVSKYIEGKEVIDWNKDLESAGIISEKQGFRVKLKTLEKPGGRQKDLLDKLGYNQWRKLLQKTK